MRALGLLLALFCLASPVAAQARESVDLELVLAADGSGSIDEAEFRLQRQGYARAIQDRQVLNAIQGGRYRKIALAFVEWASPTSVATIVDWRLVSDAASAKAFADALVAAPRKAQGWNSISAAIVYSQALIEGNAYEGARKIIDISGDGPQMNGPPLEEVRAAAIRAGITINAIAIKTRGGSAGGRGGVPLEVHYERDVIGGPDAFVMVADETTPFEFVVLRKLVREIAARPARQAGSAADGGRSVAIAR
jgi:hypothetical protein